MSTFSNKLTTELTCVESFLGEDAYHYHSANHRSNHWAKTPDRIPLQRNYLRHWEAAYNSTVHPVAARTNALMSWRGLESVVVAAAAAAAEQNAWNWSYFVYHTVAVVDAAAVVVAAAVAAYIAADHIVADARTVADAS